MRLLVFSDLHCNVEAARALVRRAPSADVIVGAGDFAVMRRGIDVVIDLLAAIDKPCVLVPGNAESDDELREATAGWPAAQVLHGSGTAIDGVDFFGLGAAVPVTPFGDWSFDLAEGDAEQMLEACPQGAVLVSHSPPYGHVDVSSRGRHLGSRAVRAVIDRVHPSLVVCGHIHDSWGQRSQIDDTIVINAGPTGAIVDLPGAPGQPSSSAHRS